MKLTRTKYVTKFSSKKTHRVDIDMKRMPLIYLVTILDIYLWVVSIRVTVLFATMVTTTSYYSDIPGDIKYQHLKDSK